LNEPTVTIRIKRVHIWALLGVLAGIGAGFVLGRASAPDSRPILYGVPPGASASSSAGAESVQPKGPVKVTTTGRPARGPANAKVTMVEFVDYQCPFCGALERDTMPSIVRNYGDRVRIVSRQFPLSIHPHAMAAAITMECAYRQGRFWQLHDALFHHQDELDAAGLDRQAKEAGLDLGALRTCRRSAATTRAIEKDVADGRAAGVTGTPTVFVNGKAISGAQPYSQFKTALDAALKG
jgi:protein-disulfide isomerase